MRTKDAKKSLRPSSNEENSSTNSKNPFLILVSPQVLMEILTR
jgi:hypothetical protein